MKEAYRMMIIGMLSRIESERFLQQIWTILRRHMQREGEHEKEMA